MNPWFTLEFVLHHLDLDNPFLTQTSSHFCWHLEFVLFGLKLISKHIIDLLHFNPSQESFVVRRRHRRGGRGGGGGGGCCGCCCCCCP